MNKALLIILDGFGCRKELDGNAIRNARKPFIDKLIKEYPHTVIDTSGEAVGLAEGQMGNSEVGHMNIGSGRIIYQDSMRIKKSIQNGDFFSNQTLIGSFNRVKQKQSRLHIIGLVSNGGVHSHQDHLFALLEMAAQNKLSNVFIHVFTDGRDTAPNSGLDFIHQLEKQINQIGIGQIASVSGRFYAMDRDKRWERTEQAYKSMIGENSQVYKTASEGIEASYQNNQSDEFIKPFCVADNVRNTVKIEANDVIISFNYRSDRLRQISRVFADKNFKEFQRTGLPLHFVQFTEYDASLPLPTVFPAQQIQETIGEVVAKLGFKQLRAAETEKYAHVTFFLNGGLETAFVGEDRILVKSPKVETYDLQPEMSAFELTDKLCEAIKRDRYQLIVCNYANSDMVGHTGIYEAAIKAVETLDTCLEKLVNLAIQKNIKVIITADHGNAEQMIEPLSGQAFTQHTTGPVPLIVVDKTVKSLVEGGRLCDVAPSLLNIMNIKKPDEMTGNSLIER